MFQAGFSQCASEACGFLLSLPGLDERVGRRLVAHLGQCLASPLSVHVPPRPRSYSPPLDLPPTRPPSSASSPCLSTSPCVQDLSRPLDGLLMTVDRPGSSQDEDVWRPWQPPYTQQDGLFRDDLRKVLYKLRRKHIIFYIVLQNCL